MLCGAPHTRRRLRIALIALVVLAAGIVAVKEGRFYLIPQRFEQVEPGLYRSAQLRRWPYERVVREHHIKTVLRLNVSSSADPGFAVEREVLSDAGVELLAIPMDQGTGIADFALYDRVADVLADPARRPLLFHCAAGDKRSAAAQAAYRMRCCGWDWERTERELTACGLRPSKTRLRKYLERYYREWVLPHRAQPGSDAATRSQDGS